MHERPIGDLVDALRALGRGHPLPGAAKVIRRCAIGPGRGRAARGRVDAMRGDVSSQFLIGAADGAAARSRARCGHAVDVAGELISQPYVEITSNLMRRFGVDVERDGWTLVSSCRPARATRVPGRVDGRRRRVVGVVFSRGRRDRRRPGAGQRRRARQSSRATSRSPTCWRAMGATIRCGDDWIEARAARAADGHRCRLHRDSRRGDDAGGRRAVRRRPDHAAQHRQLAGQGNRPHRRDGDRAAKLGAGVEAGRRTGCAIDPPPSSLRAGDDRHLRRSPDGDVLLARGARRRRGPHQRSALRAQDLSGLFRTRLQACGMTLRVIMQPDAGRKLGDRRRRSSPSTARPPRARARSRRRRRGARLSSTSTAARSTAWSRSRRCATGIAARRRARAGARWPRALDVTFARRAHLARRRDVTEAIRGEAVSAAASRVAVHPGGARALLCAAAGVSPTARAGRRRPGHGHGRLPGRRPQGLRDGQRRGAGARRYKQLIEKGISVTH